MAHMSCVTPSSVMFVLRVFSAHGSRTVSSGNAGFGFLKASAVVRRFVGLEERIVPKISICDDNDGHTGCTPLLCRKRTLGTWDCTARRRAEERKSIFLRTSTFPRMPSPITIGLPPRSRHSRPTWQQCSSRERFRTGNDISSKLAGPGGRAEVVVRCCIASFPPQISLDITSYPRGEQSTLTQHGLRTLLWLCTEQRRPGSGSRGSTRSMAGKEPRLPEASIPVQHSLLPRGTWRCT